MCIRDRSKEEIDKMKAEAAANADNDKKTREKADKINQADSLIFQTEKQIKEYGDKIPEDKKGDIDSALTELKEAHKMQDLDAIDSAMEKMNTAWTAASQDIYAATQQAENSGSPEDNTAGKGTDEEVTDVEFEEVDDK